MHEVLVNRLRGLSLPRKSVVRLTDRPDMTLDVYRGRKTTIQQQFLPQNYIREWNSLADSLVSAAECAEDSVIRYTSQALNGNFVKLCPCYEMSIFFLHLCKISS